MDNLNPPELEEDDTEPGDGMIEKIMHSLADSGLEAVIYIIEVAGKDNSIMDEEERKEAETEKKIEKKFQSVMGGIARQDAILMDNPLQ